MLPHQTAHTGNVLGTQMTLHSGARALAACCRCGESIAVKDIRLNADICLATLAAHDVAGLHGTRCQAPSQYILTSQAVSAFSPVCTTCPGSTEQGNPEEPGVRMHDAEANASGKICAPAAKKDSRNA